MLVAITRGYSKSLDIPGHYGEKKEYCSYCI